MTEIGLRNIHSKKSVSRPVEEARLTRSFRVSVCLAFICQLIGLLGPGWWVVNSGNPRSHVGIWFAIVCEDDVCRLARIDESNIWLPYHQRYQILTTCGFAVCLLAGLILILTRRSRSCFKFGVSTALMLIAGICAITASVIVGKEEIIWTFWHNTPFECPWALIFTGVGGIFSVGVAVISIIYICRIRNEKTLFRMTWHK